MNYVSLLKYTVAAAAIIGIATSATAVQAGSASGTASAAIEQALTVTENTQLNFGRVEAPATESGTVVIAAAGTVTDTGVTRLTGDTAVPAAFSLSGSNSASYTLSAIGDINITRSGGTETLGVTSFTNNASGSLDAAGAGAINIGATLTIPSTAVSGTYSGSYSVTVNYN